MSSEELKQLELQYVESTVETLGEAAEWYEGNIKTLKVATVCHQH